jgi:hypothetical protein
VGNFDGGDRDEVIAVSTASKWCRQLRFNGTGWVQMWGNNGSNSIGSWTFSSDDAFIVFDFDGDGRDEILAVSGAKRTAHLLRFDGSTWLKVWSNDGAGTIHLWHMNASDRYWAGKFGGSPTLIGRSQGGWMHGMSYSYP